VPDAVNVSKWWSILFTCCFGAQVLSLIQVIFAKIAYNTHESTIFDKCLTPCATIVNIVVQTVLFAWMHVLRYSFSGRVCSGDFLEPEEWREIVKMHWDYLRTEERLQGTSPDLLVKLSYLPFQGLLLKWCIIFNWIGLALTLCCGTCLFLFLRGK